MEYRWQIEERLPVDQEATPLRHLLQRQWLLPKCLVHYLRSRRQVLVNGSYRPVSKTVAAGDVITLNFSGDEFRTPEFHRTFRASGTVDRPVRKPGPLGGRQAGRD
ncbi:hypothetical protein ACW185_02805 [Limosilactobacillus fermentum]